MRSRSLCFAGDSVDVVSLGCETSNMTWGGLLAGRALRRCDFPKLREVTGGVRSATHARGARPGADTGEGEAGLGRALPATLCE